MSKVKRRNAGTHYTRLLEYLKENITITSLQAIRDLGNTRLSATIFELRRDGYNISSNDIPVSNRWGGQTMVAEYELISHTTIPSQQPNGNTIHKEYYHPDEVNEGVNTWLNKILGK